MQYTNGVWYSICNPVAPNMLNIADELAEPETNFTLSYDADANSIRVYLGGSLTSDWEYDPATRVVHLTEKPTTEPSVDIEYDILNTCE